MGYITESFHIDIESKFLGDSWRGTSISPGLPPPFPAPTKDWTGKILKIFHKIAISEAGIALLNSIRDSGLWLVVVPLAHGRECNAHGKSFPLAIINSRRYAGLVEFDADRYLPGSECYRFKRLYDCRYNRGVRPDEVFFHELVHAHRFSLRIRNETPLSSGLTAYTSAEEFIAVVTTNVYISDRTNAKKSGLRRNHASREALEKELSDSVAFYRSDPQVRTLIEAFRTSQEKLFDALANVDAEFNPFAALKFFPEMVKDVPAAPPPKRVPPPTPKMTGPLPPLTGPQLRGALSALAQEALSVLRRAR